MSLKEANDLFKAGQYKEALQAYEKCAVADPLWRQMCAWQIGVCKREISAATKPNPGAVPQAVPSSPISALKMTGLSDTSVDKNIKPSVSLTNAPVSPAMGMASGSDRSLTLVVAATVADLDDRDLENLDPATRYLCLLERGVDPASERMIAIKQQYDKQVAKKSPEVEVKPVKPIPADWPKDLTLTPLPDGPNDFVWFQRRNRKLGIATPHATREIGMSVVIPTFNRTRILGVTLACLVNQKTDYPFEVIVADDGSRDPIHDVVRQFESLLDIKYVRQRDYGFQVSAVRNLGMRAARYDFIGFLDCDMAPCPSWVQSYVSKLVEDDDIAYVGPRKYIDTTGVSAESVMTDSDLIGNLPQVRTNNSVAGKDQGEISVDWRLDHFKQSEDLRLCNSPFRYFSAGNIAFAKKWLHRAGWFDEEFSNWGWEDNEFGYRFFHHGCFFRVSWDAMAYHQEPPGKENETDRSEGKKITNLIFKKKVPYFYRTITPLSATQINERPMVSIYVPAYNCSASIVRCVTSALSQTLTDLEVCVCDDGSTDDTLSVLKQHFGKNPRVRIFTKPNGGIGSASNAAVSQARGFYIGQLDSDDYLEPDAVELCVREFVKDKNLACVYTTNRNVDPDGNLISAGYNWPEFSREKLATAMIVHHFRMFTYRAWILAGGFDEKIINAVDYDMYLKLSEVGPFKHLNKICYNRVLHGENTSIRKVGEQKNNHFIVVNQFLQRQTNGHYRYVALTDDPNCRKYQFKAIG